MMTTTTSARKIGPVDLCAINMALEVAAFAVPPDEYSYRTVLREAMPKLYAMRRRGMSFTKIHRLLHQAGFPIALSTLRTYYNESLLDMRDECERYFRKLGAGQ